MFSIRRQPSRLERLPLELLERIYLLGLLQNLPDVLNLPRSSPYLGSALSSNYIKHFLFDLAFGRVMSCDDPSVYGVNHEHLDRGVLQRQLLDLHYFTWDFICHARRSIFSRLCQAKYRLWAKANRQQVKPGMVDRINLLFDEDPTDCSAGDGTLKELNIGGDLGFNIRVSRPKGILTIKDAKMGLKFFQYWLPDYVKVPLPRRLLSGPWSPEDCALLGHLVSEGLYVATEDEQTAGHGLDDAIVDGMSRISNATEPSSTVVAKNRKNPCPESLRENKEKAEGDCRSGSCRDPLYGNLVLPITS